MGEGEEEAEAGEVIDVQSRDQAEEGCEQRAEQGEEDEEQ
jgi:hypothetical protein